MLMILSQLVDNLNAKTVDRILETYKGWSRQQANFEKSSIYFSRNTPQATKRNIKDILGFKEMKHGSGYLGNSLLIEKNLAKLRIVYNNVWRVGRVSYYLRQERQP